MTISLTHVHGTQKKTRLQLQALSKAKMEGFSGHGLISEAILEVPRQEKSYWLVAEDYTELPTHKAVAIELLGLAIGVYSTSSWTDRPGVS